MKLESAPRCTQCDSEMPNGLKEYPEFCICQNRSCPNYGLFQAGKTIMKELDTLFPYPLK